MLFEERRSTNECLGLLHMCMPPPLLPPQRRHSAQVPRRRRTAHGRAAAAREGAVPLLLRPTPPHHLQFASSYVFVKRFLSDAGARVQHFCYSLSQQLLDTVPALVAPVSALLPNALLTAPVAARLPDAPRPLRALRGRGAGAAARASDLRCSPLLSRGFQQAHVHCCLHSRLNPALDQLFAADTAKSYPTPLPASAPSVVMSASGSSAAAPRFSGSSRPGPSLQVRARRRVAVPAAERCPQHCRASTSALRWKLSRA